MHDRKQTAIAVLVLAAATLAVYARVYAFDFVNIDDNQYVTENPVVQGGLTANGIAWAFTTTEASFWHPSVWLSHMAVVSIAGLHAGAHHVVNVILHFVCVWLLFVVLRGWTARLWPSFFVALLFAIHPLHVESVAWVSQRKDVLSTVFWMLTLLAYGWYARKPGVSRYACVATAFVLGLMAKPMLVTLPCVLLLLDFWPLGRFAAPLGMRGAFLRRLGVLAIEKLPLLLVSAVFSWIAYAAQAGGEALGSAPLAMRIKVAVVAYGWYLWKAICPYRLAVFYPYPADAPSTAVVLGVVSVLAAITALTVWQSNRRPYLLVGWLWYLGTLVPVSGIVQVGHYAWADRFSYVPLIGIFVAVVWGVSEILASRPGIAMGIGASVAAALAVVAGVQVQYWRSSETLFRHALAVTDANFLAHNNLGVALLDAGDRDGAAAELHEALAINPRYADAYSNLGIVSMREGRTNDAMGHLREAIALQPRHVAAHINLGNALLKSGEAAEAVTMLSQAVDLAPGRLDAEYDLALALDAVGRSEESLVHFERVLARQPDDTDAGYHYGMALAGLGRIEDAMEALEHVVQIDGSYGRAWLNLGIAQLMQGLYAEALESLQQAVRLLPDDPDAHYNLGMTLGQTGKGDAAVVQFKKTLELEPDHAGARGVLERLGQSSP